MKARKSRARPLITRHAQLDLFSQPTPASDQSNTLREEAPPEAVVVQPPQAASALECSSPSDPLVEFVLTGRRRGRPEKVLEEDGNEVAGSSPDLVDVRAAARILGLSKSTLDKMRCTGKGPPFVRATERAVRYDPVDLWAFKSERRRRSTSCEVLSGSRR